MLGGRGAMSKFVPRSAGAEGSTGFPSADRRRVMRLLRTPVITAGLAVAVLISTAGLGAPASAESLTVTLTDPVGDALHKAPGYLDIIQAEAKKQGQNFEFRTVVAAPIPLTVPNLPPANRLVLWVWGLDTDPTTAPQGTPVSPGVPIDAEFALRVVWDGNAFSGEFIDRTPLPTGGEAVITPLPVTITSNQVSMAVRASAVGNPTSFLWDIVTIYWSSQGQSLGWHPVDFFDPFFNPWP